MIMAGICKLILKWIVTFILYFGSIRIIRQEKPVMARLQQASRVLSTVQ